MIELEIDGKKVSAEPGSTILEIALKDGKYIPHFCYHKKLSIAANCRMCLVEVEKAPKPLPACATPVTEGMKVQTCSKLAIEAQKGVMEFLLINHPLDCPICDQGGECQLQDLAVGYGRSESRFEEEKRAVSNKDLGSLVSTEMTRCIHCSRCIRFGEEIGGYQELGMSYRNNHVEVMPFIGKTVNSELSGNMIDICPVGALTSKPFRNQYRSWELSRRKSIAPHDGLGSNIIVQIDKYHKVVRVLPLENEDINECWISDRDRFSYEGLYHEERVTEPQIKQDGKWMQVDWDTAIEYAAKSINGVKLDHGVDEIAVLASGSSTTEELYLLQKLMRNFGVSNLDYRLAQTDFSLDGKLSGTPYLGGLVNEFAKSKSILVIGSVLREEQPLIASRIRNAVKHGTMLNTINVLKEDLLCNINSQILVDPRTFAYTLAQIVKATSYDDNSMSNVDLADVEVSVEAQKIADNLKQGNGFIVLGEIAKSLPNYAEILTIVAELAKNVNAKFGVLSKSANEVGADLVGFVPFKGAFHQAEAAQGANVMKMLDKPRRAYVLLNTELEYDAYDAAKTLKALNSADTVVVLSAYLNNNMKKYADVILPITPFTETAGSYVNMEGKWQKFNGVTRPLGNSKPGWKVLRVLANNLGIAGFDYNTIDEVRNELSILSDTNSLLSNNPIITDKIKINKPDLSSLIRFGIQGIYNADSITRRAPALQQTTWAQQPTLSISGGLAKQLQIDSNIQITIEQNKHSQELSVALCDRLPDTVVLLAVNDETTGFTGRFDPISIKNSN
jgi:NADH-quinone oxidoreductase subunit G